MARPEFAHSFFGVMFVSVPDGKVLYAHNAEKFFVPGSTTKLVTTGAALDVLGAEHRFVTRVYRTGPVGADGTLEGDLVLVASGDPNLSGRLQADGTLAFENADHSYGGEDSRGLGDALGVIRGLAKQVHEKGVRRISGRVLVDATLFPEGDRELGTGVVISPIMVNDNVVDAWMTPGPSEGASAALRTSPLTSYVRFVNEVKTGAKGSRAEIRFAPDVAAADGSRTVTVTGTVPAGSREALHSYPVPEPSRFTQVVFAEALNERGILASAGPRESVPDWKAVAASYVDERVVAEHRSAPMSEEAKVILKVSQNLHASAMPFILGSRSTRGPAAAQAGFDLMRRFLDREGLKDGASQGDGAGGAAHFTPAFMTRFLLAMAKHKASAAFFAALPVLGRDGTLFNIQTASSAAGHVFAKTGTYGEDDPLNRGQFLNGKGLAGYVDTKDGRRLAFAAYLNHVALSNDPDAIRRTAGETLGAIAAAAYDAR